MFEKWNCSLDTNRDKLVTQRQERKGYVESVMYMEVIKDENVDRMKDI